MGEVSPKQGLGGKACLTTEPAQTQKHGRRSSQKNPKQPLVGLLDQEFALGHEPGVVLVSPNDYPGRCPLTRKWPVMTAQGQPVTLGVG